MRHRTGILILGMALGTTLGQMDAAEIKPLQKGPDPLDMSSPGNPQTLRRLDGDVCRQGSALPHRSEGSAV